jgi:hypothetical protein
MSNRIEGAKIRCVGRTVSKPRLIHQTGKHRAIEVFIEGKPARAEIESLGEFSNDWKNKK